MSSFPFFFFLTLYCIAHLLGLAGGTRIDLEGFNLFFGCPGFFFFFHVRKLAAPQRQHLREIFIVVFTESTLGLCVCYLNSNSSAVCWPNIVSVMHGVTVFARRLR